MSTFKDGDYVVIMVQRNAAHGDVDGQFGRLTKVSLNNHYPKVQYDRVPVRCWTGVWLGGSRRFVYHERELRHAEEHEILAAKLNGDLEWLN